MILPVLFGAGIVSAMALMGAEGARTRAAASRRRTERRAERSEKKVERIKRKARKAVARAEQKRKPKAKAELERKGKAKKPPTPAKHKKIKSHKVKLVSEKKKEAEPELKPRQAAKELYSYVSQMIGAGRARELGDKRDRNGKVKRLQKFMGRLVEDGIYGNKTRARGKELLGRDFPARTPKLAPRPLPVLPREAKPKPKRKPTVLLEEEELLVSVAPLPPKRKAKAERTPKAAARDLFEYVDTLGGKGRSAALGFKGNPNRTVLDAQTDMGELKKDGIYGNKTRRRGRALIGKRFPPR